MFALAPVGLALSTSSTAIDTKSFRQSQTLVFKDATTDVPVHIIGSIHYNPYSVSKVDSILSSYVKDGRLGSVAIESCEKRWNKIQEIQPSGTRLRRLLDNEFQAAAEATSSLNKRLDKEGGPIRLILADEDIDANNDRVLKAFSSTLSDLVDPKRGWEAIASDIRKGYIDNFSPADSAKSSSNKEEYLGLDDIFDGDLLRAAPISLIRYIFGFVAKKPLPGFSLLAWLAALLGYGMLHGMGDLTAAEEIKATFAGLSLNILFGVPLLGRVLLITLLSDRNVILASNVRKECKRLQSEGRGDKICVVVLGLAHCNGVKQLLCEDKLVSQ